MGKRQENVHTITIRLHPRELCRDDELSIEDFEKMKELLGGFSANSLFKQIMKGYFDGLPATLIKEKEAEIERIRLLTQK